MKNFLHSATLVIAAFFLPQAAMAQVNPNFDGRAKLAMDAFKAYSAEGQNARMGALAAAARLKANNGNDQAMINYIASYYDNRKPGEPGYWPSLSSVAWVVGKYRDKFTPAQLNNLKTKVKGLSNLVSSGTENHTLNYQVAGYLFAQHWPNESGWYGGRTSAQVMSQTRTNLLNIMSSLYSKGYNEDLSTTYVATHLSPYYILYDCATDPEMKKAADAAITFHVSHIASTHFEGVVVPPFNRQNAPQFNKHNGGSWNPVLQWTYWLYWGEVQNRVPTTSNFRTNSENRWFIHAALSDWRPQAAINSLAFGRTVPYELTSTKCNFQHFGAGGAGEYERYVYRDRLYAMGSGNMRFRPNGYHVDYNMFGLIYKSGDTFNYIDCHHDYWRSNNRMWLGASPFIQMAQHKGTSIVLFNIPATDPWHDRGPEEYRSLRNNHFNNLIREGLARYPKSIDEKVESGGWIFLREGDVYIAIRPLNTYTIDPNHYTKMTKPGDYLDHLVDAVAQYNVVRSPHAKTGFLFDVGTREKFTSFQAFQTAVRQNPLTVDLNSLSVTYRNSEGNTLSSTWRAPQPDYKDVPDSLNQNVSAQVWVRPNFTVNGTSIPIDSDFTGARAVIKSPSIQLVNRVLRVTTPDGNLTSDWTGSSPVISNAANNSYTVTYNANGANSGTAPGSQTKTHGATLTLATNSGNLARTGYTFAGWNTAANGSGTNYAAGGSYTVNANLSLFARWTANTYTVTYNANGATGGTAPATQTKTHDVALTLAGNSGNLARTGFTFAGWNTAADGSGTDYAVGATFTGNGNLALFAKWTTLATYSVTYNANGATDGTAPGTQIKTQGIALTLAANTGNLSRAGFTFTGWNTAANGSGTDYATGATYTGNDNLALFAKWLAVPPGGEVVTETFNTGSTTAANGWSGSGNTANNNNFGWNSTDVVLGSGTGGSAGGIFARTSSLSHFADTSIAPLTRTDRIRMAGSLRLANNNFDGAFYLGYFTPGQGLSNFIGIQFNEPSGDTTNPFRGTARVNGTGGAASSVISLAQNTTLTFDLTWAGSPDGSGVLSGTLAGQSLNIPVTAGSGGFSAFGLVSGGYSSNIIERTAGCYFDSLTYNKFGATTPPPPPANYTVSYNANGATSGTAPASQTKTPDEPLTLATNSGNLARTGFTFGGWNTAADASGTNYAAGGTFSGNADLTLFARWVDPTSIWNLAGGGGWGTAGNWSPSGVPEGIDAVVNLTNNITGNASINLNGSRTVGTLNIGDANGTHAFNINNGSANILTFEASSGSAALNLTSSHAGVTTFSIINSVRLNSDLVITNHSPVGGFNISVPITEVGGDRTLTLAGAGGTGLNTFTRPNSFSRLVVRDGMTLDNANAIVDGNVDDLAYGKLPASYTADAITLDGGGLRAGDNAVYHISANRGITLDGGGGRFVVPAPNRHFVINSVIAGTSGGGFTVEGSGSVRLNAANTYDGDTIVKGGTLVLGLDNAIPNIGSLVIDGGKVDPSGHTVTVSALYFGEEPQLAGTWGSSASAATYKNDTYFTGTGVVSVTTGPEQPEVYYTVTYHANGATSGTVPDGQIKDNAFELTLATNSGNLSRNSFTFMGWNTAADGSGTDYAEGESYTSNADVTLYARWMPLVIGQVATGGDLIEDIVMDGINYRVHHFTSTTTQTFEVLADSLEVEYLIVGGGGGGGGLSSNNASGAGGAGGYLSNVGSTRLSLAAGSYGIAVGAGGAGGTTSGTRGSQGANSSAFGLTAIGGGGGGSNVGAQQTGGAGGSGGGHGGNNSSAAAAGTSGQGNAGGTGFGGGGGAGSAGQAGGTGEGLQNSITGAAVWYAGGGAGAFKSGVTPLGGGGSADTSSGGNQATDGQPNTGGGGGASWNNGAKAGRSGGSGIVIVRYAVTDGTVPTTYTVSYNGNGATSGTAPSSQAKTHDVALTLATNSGNLARTGFTFAGWNTAADGSGTSYAAGGSYTGNANLSLFARWTANTYTVSYNANGATSGTAPSSQAKTHDVALTLTTNSGNLARTGFTFAGWNTAADGRGTDYAAGGSYTGNENLTLFAKWTANTYTFTYNANGATSGTAPPTQPKTHDVALTLATNSGNLARTGFTFAGWNTAADGSGTDYAAGGSYTGNENLTLFAKWTAVVVGPLATGGDLTEDITVGGINYRVHHFTSTTTQTFEVLADSLEVEYLIVGGGGGGGGLSSNNASGAGGAGGYLSNVGSTRLSLAAGSYGIAVGAGGAGGTTSGTRGSQGASSSAFGLTAIGGGGGGGNVGAQQTGGAGGSGGGHGGNNSSAAAAGTSGQGNAGGTGFGGGGGAGSAGQAGGTGEGRQNSITGTAVWYAGGGAGAFKSGVTPLGGGGGADTSSGGNQATNGQPNTGGGGGAIWSNGAKAGRSGGSGIVIVRYVVSSNGSTPFQQWSGAPGMGFEDDASSDGISNGMAFLLGASSPEGDAHHLLPAPARTNDGLTLSFKMRDAESRGSATMSVEYSSDLVNWTTVPVPDSSGESVDGVAFDVSGSGMHDVKVTIPSVKAVGGRLYARLKASE